MALSIICGILVLALAVALVGIKRHRNRAIGKCDDCGVSYTKTTHHRVVADLSQDLRKARARLTAGEGASVSMDVCPKHCPGNCTTPEKHQ